MKKTSDAHHPDFKDIVQAYKDRFGIDLSHVKMKWSKHPRYSNGKVDKDMPDDMSGGCHGPGIVWMNPNPREVMKRYGVDGKVKDFRRWIMAHELAHEIDSALNKRRFVNKILEEAKKMNYHSSYLDTVPEHKFDKELFAEYMAKKLSEPVEKKAEIKDDNMSFLSKIAAAAIATMAAAPAAKPATKPIARPTVRPVAKPAVKPRPVAKTPARPVAQPAAMPMVQPAVPFPTTGPVGYRNHNPGNLMSDGRTKWQGATGVPAKGKWLQFNNWTDGVRAMARTLYNYGNKHGIRTVEDVLKRYDKSGNNRENYLSHVRSKMGLRPNQEINLTDVNTLHRLVPAIGSFEIGPKYWGKYDASSVSNAVQRAMPQLIAAAR